MSKFDFKSLDAEEIHNFEQLLRAVKGKGFPRAPDEWADESPVAPDIPPSLPPKEIQKRMALRARELEAYANKLNPERLLVMTYLTGLSASTSTGIHRTIYLKGENEALGRELLASLLRSKAAIPREIRRALADLIEPTGEGSTASEREFDWKYRKKGKRRRPIWDFQVCEEIAKHLNAGKQQKVAIDEAMRKFGIKRSEALRLWVDNRDAMIMAGMLDPRSRTKSKLRTD